MRRQMAVAGMLLLLLLAGTLAASKIQGPPAKPESLQGKAFARPEMRVTSANVPLSEVLSLLPNASHWDQFLQAHGPRTAVYIDPRSGVASGIQMSDPFIPGSGKGNHLTLGDLQRSLGRKVSEVSPQVVGDLMKQYLEKNRDALGIDSDQMGPVRAMKLNNELWDISVPQVVRGVPVRYGRIVATLNHGNLVLVGAEMWGNVHLDTKPRVTAAEALRAGFDKAGGRREEDTLWKKPTLEILPVTAPGRDTPYVPGRRPGGGYSHWLVWSFGFSRGEGPGSWEVLVNALTGDVVALQDMDYEVSRKISGSVYPLTNTDFCPSPDRCGVPQAGTPMSFADYLTHAYSNSAGVFDYTGIATTTLQSPYIAVTDGCGPISEGSSSEIDLGGGSAHDCTVPFGHSAGDTSAARTAAYELNKLSEMARGWLPNNPWLQGQSGPQQINVNYTTIVQPNPYVCQAFYNPSTSTIYAGPGGKVIDSGCCESPSCSACGSTCGSTSCCPECAHECRNMGEIATIIDHEWGHALDDNDGSGSMSISSEAYADITAAYRTQTSCSGYGFKTTWPTDSEGCTLTSDGTGYNGNMADVGAPHCLTDCSGKRDSDYMKHEDMTPDTPQNFVCLSCGTVAGRSGPCGLEEHCEAAPSTQAAWDLAARDLQSPPYNYSKTKAFNVASRLHFLGSGNIQIWHTCDCGSGTSDGCGAGSGYQEWLAADDDNGDVTDGTPHMSAIYAAFSRHNIACFYPVVQDSGCQGAPTGAPALTATPGANQVALSWTPEGGASKYFVYRTEGQAGCDMGRALIATPQTTSFSDTDVVDGRQYYYTVEAVGASDACAGPTSSCVCATNPPSPVQEVCNGIDDNCNGQVDEGFDQDGDGYTTCGGDCDDTHATVHPGAIEICDGLDDDCDSYIPPEEADADGDGYRLCDGDCNDGNPDVHPGATETCNNIDDNCNGQVDEGFDADFDGWTTCAIPIPDCNDQDPRINGVEIPTVNSSCFDQLDNDCDGVVDWDCAIDVGAPENEVVEYGSVSPAQPDGLANLSAGSLNNTYETISEVNASGGQGRRLSVYWTFPNPNPNNWWALRVEGFRATSGDSYTFSVAQRTQSGACGPATGETYTTAFTLDKTADDDRLQVYQIGPPNPGTVSFCVHVVDTITSKDNRTDELTLDKLYLMPILLDAKADSEVTAVGTHINGTTWSQTLNADGAYEILQEGTGDVLEQTWKFPTVPVGYSHVLHFQGFRTSSAVPPEQPDNFQFYFATPDPVDPSQPGPFQLITGAIVDTGAGGQVSDWIFGPESTSAPLYGSVWIKVRDTVPGGTNQDKLETDYLAIRSTP